MHDLSNSLKEIAVFLGFSRRDIEANAIKSMEWRKNWQRDKEENDKSKLLTYNLDDCCALIKVHEWLNFILNIAMCSRYRK